MKKIFLILLLSILIGCDNCEKPTKKVCLESLTTWVPISNGKTITVVPIIDCLKYAEIPNKCYKGESDVSKD